MNRRRRRGGPASALVAIAAGLVCIAASPGAGAAELEHAAASFLATGECVHEAQRDDASVLFAASRVIPADASFFVHFEDAKAIRARHGGRPLATLLLETIRGATMADAWTQLAARANTTPSDLFDAAFSGRVTLATRTSADGGMNNAGGAGLEWALLLDADQDVLRELMRRWRPERLWPGDLGVEARRIPEAGIRIHVLPRTLVICGDSATGLAEDILRRLRPFGGLVPRAGVGPDVGGGRIAPLEGDVLWNRPGVQSGVTLGTGSIAAWFAHGDDRGGGWSSVVVDALPEVADRVRLAVSASFDGPPFERPRPVRQWSGDVVTALADSAMAVFAEPTEIGWGRTGAWLSRGLGQPLLSRKLQDRIGGRRLMIVGEIEGRRLDPPVDAPLPAVAMAIETRSAMGAAAELDLHMASLLRGVARMAAGGDGAASRSMIPGLVPSQTIALDGAGFADLGPAIDRWWRGGDAASTPAAAAAAAAGEDPLAPPAPLAAADLCWGVAAGPSGQWIVVASHPAQLEDVRRSLADARPGDEPAAAWASRGVIDGIRAGVHLRDLADAAGLIAPPDQPGLVEELATTLAGTSEFFATLRRCSWAMQRPDDRSVRLDVELQLADPPTATASRRGG